MLGKYKEIFFGLAFGIVAFLLDLGMDAMADGNSLVDEISEHPRMLLYRMVFIVLGLALGSLLWQRNRQEREARKAAEMLNKLRQECSTQGLLLRSSLQTILTRIDLHLSDEASRLLQEAYARTQEFQRIAEQSQPR